MIDASLTVWESGTDLVIDTEVDVPPAEVWRRIADSDECAEWFAPFTRVDEGRVRFRLDDAEDPEEGTVDAGSAGADPEDGGSLEAEVLSCEEDSHVLLEFAALGRLGISLRPTDDGTRISLTCTFASSEEAAEILPEVGPVWETHLRLLREAVGAGASDVPESELTARYEQLAAEARADSDSSDADGTLPNGTDLNGTDPDGTDANDPDVLGRPGEESSGIDYGTHDFGSQDSGTQDFGTHEPGTSGSTGDRHHDR